MYLCKKFFVVTLVLFAFVAAHAEDGMWTFDNPPRKTLKEKYHFEPSQEWLDHVRLSSVRFNDGGSGSFVSPNGLVMTNHHVALGQLQKVSTHDKDYVKDGFFTKSQAEELKCPDLELNVLVGMENVTEKVTGAIKDGMSEKEAMDARKAIIGHITKESMEKTGLRSDIVTLYQGSEYWLYQYKKYTDVRLVMAPEQQIAFFGGDPDNFTFPRYDLDMAFFRVYENNQPVKSPNYLKWKSAGAEDGELVFVSGHPGSTNRLQTMAQTEYQRDYTYPSRLKSLKHRVDLLHRYSKLGPEQERRALVQIFSIENSLKALGGEYEGLLDAKLMAQKQKEEKDLREKVAANPEWARTFGPAWDSVAAAVDRSKSRYSMSTNRSLTGRLASLALSLVRYATEIKKPNGERQREYQDANLPSLKFQLFSPAPIYTDLEELQLADRFAEAIEALGAKDPFVVAALNGKTPEGAAKDLVTGTKLADPKFRQELFEGGEAAISACTDPMIVLARKIAPMGDELREWTDKNVTGTLETYGRSIGRARFAVYGKSLYPDATFTLRLSYGTVKGYPANGTIAPATTTMFGLYDRAFSFGNKGDFELPKRFVDNLNKLSLSTPFNFVSTCDIIGGNSGSPVVNKAGECVGLIFDGNIESLPGRFLYSEEKNRAVAVCTGAMIECMRKLYDSNMLANEIEGITVSPDLIKAKDVPKPGKDVKKKK
ncbi:MAG TPA: S46 family peptidase [Bacteroidota bacterium]|nr:S46 family peptidase [Bacteroidota bacterium]